MLKELFVCYRNARCGRRARSQRSPSDKAGPGAASQLRLQKLVHCAIPSESAQLPPTQIHLWEALGRDLSKWIKICEHQTMFSGDHGDHVLCKSQHRDSEMMWPQSQVMVVQIGPPCRGFTGSHSDTVIPRVLMAIFSSSSPRSCGAAMMFHLFYHVLPRCSSLIC